MRLIAYDPFVSAERGRQLGVELLPLDQVVAESDFLTIHLPKTAETKGLIGRDLLLKAKPTLRVINVARGGIVDEAALADAVRDGVIAGAALDVFETEPTTDVAAVRAGVVVVTPHLGASTREAQDKAGDTIADMVQLALAGEFVPFAVNLAAAEAHETCGRSCRWPSGSGACSARWSASCRRRSRSASRATSAPTTPASSGCRCSRACSAGSATSRSPTSTPRSGPRTPASTCARSARPRSADYVNLITISRRRALAVGHAGRAPQRAAHRASSTGTRSTCRRPTTC